MNGPENTGNIIASSENVNLNQEVQALKFIVSFALLLCFVSSLVVFIFLLKQNSGLNAEIANTEHNLGQAAGIFNKFGEFAKTHQDYNQQVFQKYAQELNYHPGNAAPQKK